jgi:hypothetical protein
VKPDKIEFVAQGTIAEGARNLLMKEPGSRENEHERKTNDEREDQK